MRVTSGRVALESPAPDFILDDLDGRPFRLADLRGRSVLLVFNRGFG
jgi:peroxiredoxin